MPPTSSTAPSPNIPVKSEPGLNHRDSVAAFIVVTATLLAYANSLSGVFQFDDYNVIVDAPGVHSWPAWAQGLGHRLRPLLNASYALNWSLDPAPLGFHVFNLLLHLCNCGLVAALVLAFGRRGAPTENWRPAAFATALLFALHPLHTEAVTYISGRSTALMSFFYFAALLAHARRAEDASRGSLPVLLLFAAAVLSKESALLFPFALLVWEWTLGTPGRLLWQRLRPMLLLTLIAALALLAMPSYRALLTNTLALGTFHDNALTQINAASRLALGMFWPVPQNIDPDWPRVTDVRSVIAPLLTWAVLAGLALCCRPHRPWLAFAVAWAALHLLPLNMVLPRTDVANERVLYWADWGVLMACAVEVQRWRRPRLALPLLAAAALALGTLTAQRNAVYQSEVLLWQDTVLHSPDKARAWNNLGYALEQEGRKDEAESAYRRALHADPGYVKALNNLESSTNTERIEP